MQTGHPSNARKTLLAAGWVEQVEHDGIWANYMVTKSNPSRGFVAPVVFPVFAKDIVKGDTRVIFETQYDQSVAKYQAEIDRLKMKIARMRETNAKECAPKLADKTR